MPPDDRTTPSLEGDGVSCAQCQRIIPRSEAFQPEAEDYVLYFCGLDCYEQWKGAPEGTPPRPPEQET